MGCAEHVPLSEVVAGATDIQARMPGHDKANYSAAMRTTSGCEGMETAVRKVPTKRAARVDLVAAALNLPGTVLGMDIPALRSQKQSGPRARRSQQLGPQAKGSNRQAYT